MWSIIAWWIKTPNHGFSGFPVYSIHLAKQMTNIFFRLWAMRLPITWWGLWFLIRISCFPRDEKPCSDWQRMTSRAFLHCWVWPVRGQPSVVRHSGSELPCFLLHSSLQHSFAPIFVTNDYAPSRNPVHVLSTLWSDSSVSHHLPSHIFSFTWTSIIILGTS